MKKTKRDYEYLENSPEFEKRGLKRISRPRHVDEILKRKSENKGRITIYLDAEIIEHFKEAAKNQGEGYQTLINRTLREILVAGNMAGSVYNLQNNLLNDRNFLTELKAKLETV